MMDKKGYIMGAEGLTMGLKQETIAVSGSIIGLYLLL